MIGKSIQLNNGQTLEDIKNAIQSKAPNWQVKPKGKFLNVDKNGKSFLLRIQDSELKASIAAPMWLNIGAIIPAVLVVNFLAPNAGFLIRFLITFTAILLLLVIATTLYSNSNAAEIDKFYKELDGIVNEGA